MGRSIRIGDIFELSTPKGFAYVQYVYEDVTCGSLIRVLPGLFEARPSSFERLVQMREPFVVYFPLKAAVNRRIVHVVGTSPLPFDRVYPPPLISGGEVLPNGHRVKWRIYKGDGTMTLLDELDAEQRTYSPYEVWNDTLLIERICSGWKPEDDVEALLRQPEGLMPQEVVASEVIDRPVSVIQHYLYFNAEGDAQQASERLQAEGFDVEVRRSAFGDDWLVLARQSTGVSDENIENVRNGMENIAAELHGEYDGWEAVLSAGDDAGSDAG